MSLKVALNDSSSSAAIRPKLGEAEIVQTSSVGRN
jgi:hypothetical protein